MHWQQNGKRNLVFGQAYSARETMVFEKINAENIEL
jgi:hypothetical protein